MLKPGTFISERYEIIEKVGSGGMADVYKAKCHRLNRYVAIKVLKREYSDDKNFVNKFRIEAQSCAGLSHPNIVNVYDVGDEDDIHYIVMELVEGITLKSYIGRKGKLEIKEAVSIGIQIAMGMEAAHMNHIVHRDIKPQNIIISKEGKVKVTDFGIAKAINSNTMTSNTMGSVHYLSPEQARGGYSDEKSDIYSLGVTLYEMLSGRVPFIGDNTVSVALLHIQSEAIPLRELDPNIPVSVERIVQKCMQKKPERRYLSSTELIVDLKKSIANPDGDFVVISKTMDYASPTITISDEDVNFIKNASRNDSHTDPLYYTDSNGDLDYDEDDEEDDEEDEDYYDEDDDYYDEDADVVDPRMEKVVLIGTVVAAIIIVLLILFFVFKFFNLFPGGSKGENEDQIELTVTPEPTDEVSPTPELPESFDMPSVLNLTLNDAERQLKQRSKDLVISTTEGFSDTVEKGLIMEQYPSEGVEISGDSDIRLVISAGKEAFKVPNVYNYTDNQAVTILTDLELKVLHEYQSSNEIEEGRVISTSPSRDSMVVKGDTITIVVSTGPDIVLIPVPTLTNLSADSARSKIRSSGLSIGQVRSGGYSNEYPKGTIMDQNPSPGGEVRQGTAIDLVISDGPEPTPVETEQENQETEQENQETEATKATEEPED